MTKPLDHVHHIAIQIQDIKKSVAWDASHFDCEVSYRDGSWALLKLDNVSLALVLANQHPPHFAVTCEDVTLFGTPVPHRDGTSSVYIQDPSGNNVEMLKLVD